MDRQERMWLISRGLILIVFVAMPLMRMRDRIKYAPLDAAHKKCMAAYDEAKKYPVLSEGWNTNVAAGNYWHEEGKRLYVELYGTNR